MVVQHNKSADNVSRELGIIVSQKGKSAEKLSSGYKINRAADDAAGLTISEKMRWQIRGLNRASENAQEGISLLNVADGALEEIHDIIQRMRELSVQGANDTNTNEDRDAIDAELSSLKEEVNRIADTTAFNTMKLLDGSLEAKASNVAAPGIAGNSGILVSNSQTVNGGIIVQPVTGAGLSSTDPRVSGMNSLLKDSIVPQAVNAFQSTFSALSSANVSNEIGLKLYSENSSTLAYVALSYGWYSNNTVADSAMKLNLSVNLNSLSFTGNAITETSRTALETTIVHEMMHAFMDDVVPNGMIGAANGVKDAKNKFPSWFIEGMAQTAAGGCANSNNWVRNGLGLTSSSSAAQINAAVTSGSNKLSSGSTSSQYGTGYLACMYLGYLASGSGSVNASSLASGVNTVLSKLMQGDSLSAVIKSVSGGTYSGITDFQNKFGDAGSSAFIHDLLTAVGTGNGGLVGSGFTGNDPLPNANTTSSKYQVDVNNEFVSSSVNPHNWSSGGARMNSNGESDEEPAGKGLYLQVGEREGQSQMIVLEDMHAMNLGLDSLSVGSHLKAGESIQACEDAIQMVSQTRSRIGAYTNRLEHTIRNLDNTSENTQSAESKIRDTDMAEEMVEYSRTNILSQAGQAMLSQANSMPQGILALLG